MVPDVNKVTVRRAEAFSATTITVVTSDACDLC